MVSDFDGSSIFISSIRDQHTCSPRDKGPRSYTTFWSSPAIQALGSMGGAGRLSIELARDRPGIPGIQLLRFDGVPGLDCGVEPGMANPTELVGRLISRPRLCGRPPGELGALLARSWLTVVNDGGGGRLSRSNRSIGAPLLGSVRGSEKTALGVETWRVGRDWLRRRGFCESAGG